MTDPKPLIPVNLKGLEELAEELLTPTTVVEASPEKGVILAPSFIRDPENYIGIPQLKRVIAKKESDKNLQWEPTIRALASRGAYHMPNIPEFMTHFFNVREAAQGKKPLYDGRGKPLKREESTNLYNYFTTAFEGGCWTWLDAKFVKGKGFKKLDLQTNHRVDASGNLTFQQVPLEECVWEDVYVDLIQDKFNKQYLPTAQQKSADQNYKVNQNIYFFHPRKDAIAWFVTGSVWAWLYCDGDPSGSVAWLGVFLCAEGAAQKINGGKK